ncbi:uncharacterized protein LOC142540400 isoform X2 [Primulina tabacum]|uniref:uncharacterized protein LOC142540400 isoform X2 n=1 Tax=Primulina tabacum TaxID=48773 RepID=UPI003F5AD204
MILYMAELAGATEVYAPRTIQTWRTLLNCMAFFFQIFSQILRGTPSFSQVLFYVGLRHGSLLSSAPHAPAQFKRIPAMELSEYEAEVEEGPSLQSTASVRLFDAPPLRKLKVVLDLDETLVCAYETSSLPAMLRSQATEAGLKWFELECISSDKEFDGKPKINHVTVFERPGLKEFLSQLSEFAELHVLFTAGLEGYARPLVDRIDADNRFSGRLYRPSTISTTVNVDNNPFSFLLQPLNGIPCIPFSGGQPKDEQLLEVILPLLRDLSLQKDVRPILYERFHMPEWFQKHGIPTSGWPNTG